MHVSVAGLPQWYSIPSCVQCVSIVWIYLICTVCITMNIALTSTLHLHKLHNQLTIAHRSFNLHLHVWLSLLICTSYITNWILHIWVSTFICTSDFHSSSAQVSSRNELYWVSPLICTFEADILFPYFRVASTSTLCTGSSTCNQRGPPAKTMRMLALVLWLIPIGSKKNS